MMSTLRWTIVPAAACVAAIAWMLAGAAPAEENAPAPSSAATTFQIDAAHSTAMFGARRLGIVNVYGRFNQLSGSFVADEANVGASSIQLEIRTESVDSGVEGRDRHLRSADFFNAPQFPVITFKSTAVRRVDEKTIEVTGDLNLHGVTKSIVMPVQTIGEGEQRGRRMLGFESRFKLKRSEFGMNYMQGDPGISDEIEIVVAIQGIAQ
jgi:polyisoprenoid-binding protein YceI